MVTLKLFLRNRETAICLNALCSVWEELVGDISKKLQRITQLQKTFDGAIIGKALLKHNDFRNPLLPLTRLGGQNFQKLKTHTRRLMKLFYTELDHWSKQRSFTSPTT